MNEIAQRLAHLAEKVKEVIRTNERLKEENGRLQQELENLREQVGQLRVAMHSRNEPINVLSTAKPLYTGVNKEAARKRIDDLVREVDVCLTLLNS